MQEGAIVVGVFPPSGTGPVLAHAPARDYVTAEMLAALGDTDAATVMRVAIPCMERGCKNFTSADTCGFAKQVAGRKTSTTDLPRCAIRSDCLWWHQEGKEACFRCPSVQSRPSGAPAD